MSDFTATANALRARLVASFTALPLYWPNDPRDPAADTAAQNGWVLSEVRLQDEAPVSIGATGTRFHRDYGEFAIYVYVPMGMKAGTAEGHAEAIRAAFKMTDISGVIVTRRVIGSGERVSGPQGHWWSVPLVMEFWSDRLE